MNKYGNRFSQIHGCAAAKAQNAIVTTITISQDSAARGCLRGIELGIEKYIKLIFSSRPAPTTPRSLTMKGFKAFTAASSRVSKARVPKPKITGTI